MPLYRATTALAGEAAARALRDALDELDPAPLASDIHDHDDGSGLWDVGGLFDGPPDAAGLALLARLHGAPGLRGGAGRGPRLGGAGARRAHAGRGRPVRRLRQPRPGAGPAEPRSASRSRRRRPSAPGTTPRPRAASSRSTGWCGAGWWRGGSPTSAAAPASSPWRRPRSGRRRPIAGDIDPLATATARANVAANGLGGRVACVTAAGFRHPRLRPARPIDLIFANILAGPLRRLAPELAAHHAPGGVAILSGILARQAPGVTAVYRSWGYRPEEPVRIGDWATLVLRRRADAGSCALRRARGPRRPSAISPRCRPMSLSCRSDRPRSAFSVARALRQATKASSALLDERDDAEGGDRPERDARG